MPDTDLNNYPELLDQCLPWSKELPDGCRLRMRKTKKESR